MSLVTFRTLNYNPNHDPSSGRFSSGGGGGSDSLTYMNPGGWEYPVRDKLVIEKEIKQIQDKLNGVPYNEQEFVDVAGISAKSKLRDLNIELSRAKLRNEKIKTIKVDDKKIEYVFKDDKLNFLDARLDRTLSEYDSAFDNWRQENPTSSELNKLIAISNTKDGKIITKTKLKVLRTEYNYDNFNKNGDITVYRGGVLRDGYNATSLDKDTATGYKNYSFGSEESKKVQSNKLYEITVKDNNVIAVSNDELIINNTSNLNVKELNSLEKNYNPNHDDATGRFSSGGGGASIDLTKMNNDERIDYLTNTMKADYSEKEIQAASDYISMTWAGAINKYYRTGKNDNIEGITDKQIVEKATIISNMAKKSPLPKDMILYRITANIPNNLKKGDIYVDKGLGSTTAVGDLFSGGDIHYKLKINAKKGLPVVNMTMIAIAKGNKVDSQAEIIMPLNTSYKVISKDGKNIELEVSP